MNEITSGKAGRHLQAFPDHYRQLTWRATTTVTTETLLTAGSSCPSIADPTMGWSKLLENSEKTSLATIVETPAGSFAHA
jgi:hypothetical protein